MYSQTFNLDGSLRSSDGPFSDTAQNMIDKAVALSAEGDGCLVIFGENLKGHPTDTITNVIAMRDALIFQNILDK